MQKLIISSLLLLSIALPSHAEELKVIIHGENTSAYYQEFVSSPKNLLQDIFTLRKQRWSNGDKIKIFVLPSSNPVHKKFVQEFLELNDFRLNRIWNRMTFGGYAIPPTIVKSEAELVEKVHSTKGSIGYQTIDRYSEIWSKTKTVAMQ